MNQYQKVVRGRDSLRKLPELMDKLEIRNPLIVGMEPLTGTLLKRVPALLQSPVYSGFHPNPDLSDTEAGTAMYEREGCDGLISVGGGSSIDTAKAIKARMNTAGEEDLKKSRLSLTMDCPHIAIPGTAGTGSEATQFAVAYVNGMKVSLNHPALRPDGVLLRGRIQVFTHVLIHKYLDGYPFSDTVILPEPAAFFNRLGHRWCKKTVSEV